MKHEATHLRGNRYAVRPKGQLGTCGFYPKAWQVIYVNARSPEQALDKARRIARKFPHLREQMEV